MNDTQKTEMIRLRNEGMSFGKIAAELGLSANTVKSWFRRNQDTLHTCKHCGKPVQQTPGKKEKKFCSDRCRMAWWNAHRDEIKHKNAHEVICQGCGKPFAVYGKAVRKYCSTPCYIRERFGHCYE